MEETGGEGIAQAQIVSKLGLDFSCCIKTRKRSEYNSAVFFVSEDSPAIGGKWNIIPDEKAPTYELSKIYSIATLGSRFITSYHGI
ncbi:unnamed protein product [Lactuca virosa]|uniref:Uncharacterized protein n=1 Tax=Lactuca virosa TaxID=75947 RepID=A0AAU9P854_9ASTR|nr:unnamed protein product [Lactuca virosa]